MIRGPLPFRIVKIKNTFFISLNSPTRKVSGFVLSAFKQVKHSLPMLSLDNTYSYEEMAKWHERIMKKLNTDNIEFIVEPKIDGVSANLIYSYGNLITGATRGDGEIGEDITENIKVIQDIPHKLKIIPPPIFFELRGEVYISKYNFKKMNEDMIKANAQKFANSRNAASGSLRHKDIQITSKRKLSFFGHSFARIDGKRFQKQSDFLKYCKECGFLVQNDFKICNSLEKIVDFIDIMLVKRDSLQYEIDGLVIKVNSLLLQNELGYTNKSPRWAIAFKFPAKQATTRLNKIQMQVGRSGIVTPSALLDPFILAGVTISHATLHNFKEIERLNVNEGDVVLIERAGDVIPKIVKVIKKREKGFFKPPTICPSCNGLIVKGIKEVAYRCVNPECSAQFRGHLIHFVSRNAMDINGFGKILIDQLLEKKKIQTLADIYSLTYDDFIVLNLFKEKKTNILLKSIVESKKQPLYRLLFALGIRHIGEKASMIIANRFRNMEFLFNARIEDFIKIPGIGEVLALSLKEFFENKNVRNIVNALIVAGVNMLEPETVQLLTLFENKTFVLTGELENYTREQACEIISSFGGKIAFSVSKNIDYILVGANVGSKFERAKELGISILYEKEFEKLVKINKATI